MQAVNLSNEPFETNKPAAACAISSQRQMVVIGAGVIGLVTACCLQQQGHQVLLLDGNGVGQGCSFGNAGHLATEQVFPLADPALLPKLPGFLLDPLGPLAIRPRYFLKALPFFVRFINQMRAKKRSANMQALKQLLQSAIPAWQQLLAEAGCAHLIKTEGSLLVFEQTEPAQVELVAQSYAGQGVAVEVLTSAQLQNRFPGLAGSIRYAIWFKDVGQTISPNLLNQALFQWFISMGGQFLQQKVAKISSRSGLAVHLEPNQIAAALQQSEAAPQIIATEQLVVCAGVHSKSLLAQLGYKLPIEAERGYHLMTSPTVQPQLPIASFERKMIMTPMLEGLRLAGTVEFAGTELADNWQRAERLRLHGEALWPALFSEQHIKNARRGKAVATATGADTSSDGMKARPANCWSGMRPTLPDSLPVISGCDIPGLWFHLGHQHLGLTMAASSTRLLLKLMAKEPGSAQLAAPFSLKRFN